MLTDEITPDQMYSIARSDYDAMAGIQNLPDLFPTSGKALTVDYLQAGIHD